MVVPKGAVIGELHPKNDVHEFERAVGGRAFLTSYATTVAVAGVPEKVTVIVSVPVEPAVA